LAARRRSKKSAAIAGPQRRCLARRRRIVSADPVCCPQAAKDSRPMPTLFYKYFTTAKKQLQGTVRQGFLPQHMGIGEISHLGANFGKAVLFAVRPEPHRRHKQWRVSAEICYNSRKPAA